ncbi:DUF2164 domain-containing protein [Virgibacillus halodenitrificans]|jgi:uncharacterized protein (DUF2164 family)|uniref:DUF2164 domain-containing protein n=1 Tax=Virgibacillus halodenitrificans TaxID=1482 RepID=A0AAC9J0Q1_VIRHA|nr:DUF2164 domain-containing protein [Virgibacillus halodenitrificans]APC49216.1 hypothetical protein BME96_13870 [Virgibacillus halodenitrificans]MBD1222232.1 DUF2164 domain-containing protein [Virgibacillus halodenitrificans]MCG1026762.1 DUF2164 domain-containing protein [Virgibacillus halodenitrificans]MCJ0930165.1 DUF2164 domain-containing protein [Virgibacillus halodenitrificans]MEC2160616.1 DUF2164 domain-containing protein [Virgibacillus halodenitrificans]
MNSKFEITKEQKEEMAGHIQAYFEQERGEDIGNLAALMFLDFFMDKLAPVFYNLGVEDSHTYMTEKLDDLFAIQKV